MASCLLSNESPSGFVFDNCRRNKFLETKGFNAPRATKTGTTIAGVVFKDGVVLGADTRATEGTIISDKNCAKIHHLTENIYCCGAGTAADTEMTTRMISSRLTLLEKYMERIVPVKMAATNLKQHLFKYQGHIGAALVLGGFDQEGPHLYSIHPHGSTDKLPYTTMGSGCLAAMSVFESRWKINMTLEEAKSLVRDAIAAGIRNDLGSGSNVDLCVITKKGKEPLRPYDENVIKKPTSKQAKYTYPKGATAILSSEERKIEIDEMFVRDVSYPDFEKDGPQTSE